MIIANANIVFEDKIIKGYIEFDNEKIINIQQDSPNKKIDYDANGQYLLPAFFDSHTHGGYGMDFNMVAIDTNYRQKLAKYFKNINKEGVGSILMTTVTCSDKDLNNIANNYLKIKDDDVNNVIKGWYIEGPYISRIRKGAHNEKLIRPIDSKELKKIKETLPDITKLLTIAPEYQNNYLKLNKLKQDFFLSIGHSDCNYQMSMHSFKTGANRITHMYNAMANFDKRNPTLINAIINSNVYAELICDGAHVANEVILNTYKMLGSDRIMIISDSLLTKGLKDGKYIVWNTKVDKKGYLDYLIDTTTIAGGNLPFNKQVENFGHVTKCSMIDILKVSSLNAAKSLKLNDKIGTLKKGANSSFVLLDNNYKLKVTFINGRKI
ncbi:MAG: N-acetylglucosamine-6-phosphate deacetylase [Mycoplasmataceae bacterium]|nr:N-acetylglucosamine-6-phosphate deacetylase [Mycoplasmataceae bacterium]